MSLYGTQAGAMVMEAPFLCLISLPSLPMFFTSNLLSDGDIYTMPVNIGIV